MLPIRIFKIFYEASQEEKILQKMDKFYFSISGLLIFLLGFHFLSLLTDKIEKQRIYCPNQILV